MNIEDRRDCIVKVFARYLYGHLKPSSFHVSNGGWSDWANLVRRFAESLEHPKNKRNYDEHHEIERLQNEMVQYASTVHQSRFFPIEPYLKEKLYHKIKELFDDLNWTISAKFQYFMLYDKDEKKIGKTNTEPLFDVGQMLNEESEYLFKTYEILEGK